MGITLRCATSRAALPTAQRTASKRPRTPGGHLLEELETGGPGAESARRVDVARSADHDEAAAPRAGELARPLQRHEPIVTARHDGRREWERNERHRGEPRRTLGI